MNQATILIKTLAAILTRPKIRLQGLIVAYVPNGKNDEHQKNIRAYKLILLFN
jgi:hypothetical protein